MPGSEKLTATGTPAASAISRARTAAARPVGAHQVALDVQVFRIGDGVLVELLDARPSEAPRKVFMLRSASGVTSTRHLPVGTSSPWTGGG
jgi:hypothetical protein